MDLMGSLRKAALTQREEGVANFFTNVDLREFINSREPAAGVNITVKMCCFSSEHLNALSGECADDRRGRGRRDADVSTTEVKSVYAGSGGYGTLKYLVESRSAARNDRGARRSADRTEFATGDARRIQFAPQDASGERTCTIGRTKTVENTGTTASELRAQHHDLGPADDGAGGHAELPHWLHADGHDAPGYVSEQDPRGLGGGRAAALERAQDEVHLRVQGMGQRRHGAGAESGSKRREYRAGGRTTHGAPPAAGSKRHELQAGTAERDYRHVLPHGCGRVDDATKRLESVIPAAHDGAVVSLQFLTNEPLLLSSGSDNSIKLWIFDHLNGGTARLLKSREGHRAPPTRIRYYGNNTLATMADGADGTCCQILSAGQDRAFRVFHTAREQQSRELSQGPILKKARRLNVRVEDLKLPPIAQFAAMETRARDWANVVTCHENEIAAYVWRFENRAIGKKVLRQFDPSNRVPSGSAEDLRRKKTQATSVAISSCGNYALVGSLGGCVFRYNMQSGEARGSFPVAATPKAKIIRSLVLPGTDMSTLEDKDAENTAADAHNGPVSAVAIDALNETLVSAGIDGKLKFWGFKKHELRYEIDVGSPISQMELHRDSNLLCVACDDQVLRLFDVTTHKLVRRFAGHSHRVTDMTFSSDARWLFSSSADASLRVWDIPTGKCVDWLRFHKPVTGLAVSPTGEFLATTHVGHVGIFLWANRSFFTEVFLDSEPTEPVLMDMPVSLNEVDNSDQLGYGTERNPQLSVSSVDEHKPQTTKEEEGEESSDPLDASLITLSTAPRAFWQSLFNLELIKKRNKPIEPPKAPEQAPFFLQTARKDDVHPTFVPVAPEAKKEAEKKDEEDVAMDGWGVGDDDEAWGDDDGEEPEDDAEVAIPSSRIVKTEGMVTSRCKLATLLAEVIKQEEEEDETISRFHSVAVYMQSLSASAVDVEMSTLCMGDFDEEGAAGVPQPVPEATRGAVGGGPGAACPGGRARVIAAAAVAALAEAFAQQFVSGAVPQQDPDVR
ncbi:hypothetical protein ON010_g361 [Phytophthora cinnamomi]|nr:hypothetical protein ON010_g361 [Phytophthora cinnamomi]